MNRLTNHLIWLALGVIGAFALGYVALNRGESISALWIIIAAVGIYMAAFRYYSLYIADKVLGLDSTRMTPAWRHNDGLDYVPTNKKVLFGHHFAAIAGAGPLVGPVLAAQMGYLPGMLWLIAGVVLAGAVQDFMVLFVSTRRDGRSLGDLVKMELGLVPGIIALFGAFMIMIIILAVLALIVVKALAESPWGTFTVMSTLPIALLMGLYIRYVRPGRVGEVSIIGFVLLLLAIWGGQVVSQSPVWGPAFTFTGVQLAWTLIIYGSISAVLPVWLLLAPRDYLATFLKIGFIVGLAIGIFIVHPQLEMPALTQFAASGKGPAWAGSLFPFLFITIACGAVSGFHALISSGTTPKMLENETHARVIGYGAMLMESFVAIMALVAASVIQPGIYFTMNSPGALIGHDPASVAQVVSSWGFVLTPDMIIQVAKEVGEHTIISRAGGAPTLAVGMAHIMHNVMPSANMMAFWYHFAILFEALFILTALDGGTRAGRFMLQDLIGTFVPAVKKNKSLPVNILTTVLCVGAWGYFLYQGVVDPLGGINTLWPLFGIANQMLAAIALVLCAAVLFKMKRGKYAWTAILPTVWLLICTMSAGWIKVFSSDLGFFSLANRAEQLAADGKLMGLAKTPADMARIAFNNRLDGTLTLLFMLVVLSIVVYGVLAVLKANKVEKRTDAEVPYEALPAGASANV